MAKLSRRGFLQGVSAAAVTTALPAVLPISGYQTETFQEAERAGLIFAPTENTWGLATAEEIYADIVRVVNFMIKQPVCVADDLSWLR
jgi:hypothetical protein